jgi:hypothetical protein
MTENKALTTARIGAQRSDEIHFVFKLDRDYNTGTSLDAATTYNNCEIFAAFDSNGIINDEIFNVNQ